MEKVEMRLADAPAANESFADRMLALVAMAGAVIGGIGGTVLGADLGTAFPLAFGTLGTMIGSGAAAGGWCLLARAWEKLFTTNADHHPLPTQVGAPVPRLG